ncbi:MULTISPECIES: NAD(P)-dependent oxidoreductase [Vibrio]|uniref:NAD(P)-dependent oxidoreductase n=1 Tax=Vibrio paracholerae TaxID=650003 RepID=A0ABD7FZP2_9VIBR|nr:MULTISPECIES: NAD(P)-dependent oxidoreductase [Vibrio]OFJ24645.1 NAD-dependent dehydratase [Vibrio paracholerae]RBM72260.1 NAD(P)-dependent oxidoreductase [Vibrio paracholerae]RNE57488.1 NAD(P)-dependent oxidoreductase [Vibrio cholerae]TXX47632.1 NAD(P)-dependent oxidoreductase [Vibrio cholerae]TYA09336.1 NAD(P)-dependent oxidoreductase [Vibrio cholerae]
MKVAILGASGWIGSQLVAEAKMRGHEVVAVVRDPAKVTMQGVTVHQWDSLNPKSDLNRAVHGVDAVIASVGGRAVGNHDMVAKTAQRLLAELPEAGVNRLLWVGGAGSLEVAPGVKLVTVPGFPEEYKGEALAQGEALEVFRASNSDVNWTFVSPAAEIFPGDKQGQYRVGGDQLLTDSEGNSRISVADYAAALIDELEYAEHPRQRIGVAY